jgi:hypothetical protein
MVVSIAHGASATHASGILDTLYAVDWQYLALRLFVALGARTHDGAEL